MTEQNVTAPESLNYYALIRGWATDRSIIGGDSTPLDQFVKGLSEAGELWNHIGKNQLDKLKDDIGDILVCLTNALAILDINIEDVGSITDEEYLTIKNFYSDFTDRRTKRLSLLVLRSLAEISEAIEDAQFEDDDALLTDTLEENLGHLVGVLILMAEDQGWTLEDCLEKSWNDIKNRKGVMLEGTFIKEDDIQELDQALNIRDKLRPGKALDYINDLIERLAARDEKDRIAKKYPEPDRGQP